ncbi:MAG: hypothetical protein FWG88_06985 [Oscillospiraceae bacterium]|nr:hypothetical protein [Oscillospiraceae bacterium]
MKKTLKMLFVILLVICMFGLVACSGGNDTSGNTISTPSSSDETRSVSTPDATEENQSENTSSASEETQILNTPSTSEEEAISVVYLESDSLPVSWHGDWVCVYSEDSYFNVNETILVKDFNNAVRYVNLDSGYPTEVNRWFFYDESDSRIDVINEQPPYIESEILIRSSYRIIRANDTEIVLTNTSNGDEVRFHRPSDDTIDNEDTIDNIITPSVQPQPPTTTVDWVEFLEEYEAWVDRYIELQIKFDDDPNDFSILTEYMSMLDELMDWYDKSIEIELAISDNPAALAEYLTAMTRILEKMSEIG